jgi:hypothetical protein
MRYLAMLAAALLVLSGWSVPPAQAQAGKIASRNAEQVTLAFNPPLDTTLRFRVSRFKRRNGGPAMGGNWVEEARFVRSGNGYILYWRIDPASLPQKPQTGRAIVMQPRPMTEALAFDLDSEGGLLRIRDWDAVRTRLDDLAHDMAVVLVASMGSQERIDKVAGELKTALAGMSAEDAPVMILRNLTSIFDWCGMSMRVGEELEGTIQQPIPIVNGSVSMTTRVNLISVDPGRTAIFTMRGEVDRDQLKQMVNQVVARTGMLGNSARDQRLKRELEQLESMSLVDTTRAVIDLPTGLPVTLENERRVTVDGQWSAETLKIEWLR